MEGVVMSNKWIDRNVRLPDIWNDRENCDILVLGSKFGQRRQQEYWVQAYYDGGKFMDSQKNTDLENNPDYWMVTHWMVVGIPRVKKKKA